jgi:hypothetical protein
MNRITELLAALCGLPDDIDMIEHNPDEGESFFCCKEPTHLNMGKVSHAPGCWYARLRAAAKAVQP